MLGYVNSFTIRVESTMTTANRVAIAAGGAGSRRGAGNLLPTGGAPRDHSDPGQGRKCLSTGPADAHVVRLTAIRQEKLQRWHEPVLLNHALRRAVDQYMCAGDTPPRGQVLYGG